MYGFLNCTVLIFKGRDDNFLESPEARRAAFSPFWGSDTFLFNDARLYTLSEYRHENGHFGRTLFGREMKSAERRMELKRRGGNHWPFSLPMA